MGDRGYRKIWVIYYEDAQGFSRFALAEKQPLTNLMELLTVPALGGRSHISVEVRQAVVHPVDFCHMAQQGSGVDKRRTPAFAGHETGHRLEPSRRELRHTLVVVTEVKRDMVKAGFMRGKSVTEG